MSEFKIGGKAIAIKDSSNGTFFKKGDIRTVLGLRVCECGSLKIDFGITVGDGKLGSRCSCGMLANGTTWWCRAESWRPLQELSRELSSTTVEELLNEAVEV